ncbi:MAG: ABC transporter ATP-binding protein [Clostridia bacterium]|nr:ABC transporter ATP-binding protein [Clostridia bacterium]MBQ7913735.1 ABC transporter ATP-binding protein [Clostridia bacterium]
MREIFKGIKKYIPRLIAAYILEVLSTLCAVALPTLMTGVVDNGINAGDMQYVYKACAIMAAVTVLDVALIVFSYKLGNEAIIAFNHDLRVRIFGKVLKMPAKEVKKYGVGGLLTRSLDDADRICDVAGTVLSVMASIPITLIAGTVLAFRKSPLLAGILLAFTPIVVLVVFLCGRNTHKHWHIADEEIDRQNTLIRARLSGIRVVRAFNQEPTEQAKIERATRRMSKSIVRGNMRSELVAPISMFVLNVATVLIVAVGAQQMTKPNTLLTAGGVLAVIEYVGMITTGILNVSYFLSEIPRFRTNCRRVKELLTAKDENEGFVRGEELKADGSIRFENVGFSYTGDGLALSGVTAEIGAGETAAFIGGTGSGKSTLVRLLCGLDTPTEGKIFFGDKDISAYPPVEIRKNISCVRQRDAVFSGTLKNSVDGAGAHTEDEVRSVLADGQMQGFLEEKEEGLEYALGERGSNLSGGQKQRVCISRALLKDAPIYIFDDSFSALDFLTESRLRGALKKRLAGKTQLIVTQRVSTARTCDKILVFDGGKLAAVGKHEELVKNCALYREIHLSQSGEGLTEAEETEAEYEREE